MKRFLLLLLMMILIPYVTTLAWTGRLDSDGGYGERYGIPEFAERANEKTVTVERNGRELDISVEEFLINMLAAQIPAEYGPETLKAQAVLARTYIYREMNGARKIAEEALDVDALSRTQMERLWGSGQFAENYGKLKQAIEETAGIAITYNGEYIEPLFCRAASGTTRSHGEEFPYLRQAASVGDTELEGFLTTTLLTAGQLAARINSMPGAVPVAADSLPQEIQIVERDGAGYVIKIQIGQKTYDGEDVQDALGLPSACYSFDEYGGKIRISTKGFGHGYGFSQAGANALERDGYTYRDLLQYYFQNIEIENIL